MEYADTIHHEVTIKFGWRDRLKILLNGRAIVKSRIDCEVPPGATNSRSEAFAPVLFPRNSGGEYAEMGASKP